MSGEQCYVDAIEKTIHRMDMTSLPIAPRDRLKRLFEMQSHWEPEKLGKLLSPVLAGQKVDPWLLKNARSLFIEIDGIEQRLLTKKF